MISQIMEHTPIFLRSILRIWGHLKQFVITFRKIPHCHFNLIMRHSTIERHALQGRTMKHLIDFVVVTVCMAALVTFAVSVLT